MMLVVFYTRLSYCLRIAATPVTSIVVFFCTVQACMEVQEFCVVVSISMLQQLHMDVIS